jgi:hypothetical protein
MEFHSLAPSLPHLPDSVTIPQFMFDYPHQCRPARDTNLPWIIDNDTGRRLLGEDVRRRTFSLANALNITYNIGKRIFYHLSRQVDASLLWPGEDDVGVFTDFDGCRQFLTFS